MSAAPALPAPPHRPSRPLIGVALIVAAVFVFAIMDTLTKHMAMRYPALVVVALRYGVNLAALIAVLGPRHGYAVMATRRTGLVLLRALSLALSSLFAALAFQRMPVAETVAIIYLAPFAVLLLAGRVLGERVGWVGWAAALVGFAGVLILLRPGGGLDALGIVFALLTAAATTIYYLLSRLLAATETTAAMLFWAALIGTVGFCAGLPFVYPPGGIPAADALLIGAMGVLSLAGHFLFTAAYAEAPASLLSPINFAQLAWVGLLGWLVFDHLPDGPSLAGIALIMVAGAGLALRAHMSQPR